MSALNLMINSWTPFEEPGFAISWSGNNASVYTWDVKDVLETIEKNGYDASNCEVIPESFIREPASEEVRLVKTMEGYEGQVWKDGLLRVTRWWGKIPSLQDWGLFMRSAGAEGYGVSGQIPTPSEPDWLETPWNAKIANANILNQALKNERYVAAGATLLVAPYAFYAAKWLAFVIMTGDIQQDIEEVQGLGQTTRIERNRALSALESSEDLLSLREYPHHIEVVSRIHNLLTSFPVTIFGWDFDDGILEFGLVSESDMDATIFIPIFENDSNFSRVSASTRGVRLVLKMNVASAEELQQ